MVRISTQVVVSPTKALPPIALASSTSDMAAPEQTPIPDTPISQIGPWLLFAGDLSPGESWVIGISNLNGTGMARQSIPISNDHGTSSYFLGFDPDLIDVSPAGDFISVLAIDENLLFEIWILRIPTFEIVKKIPLLSHEAVESIMSFEGGPGQWISPLLSILQLEDLMEWSPDGSSLAFVGAKDSDNLDVYIFETNTNDITHLTKGLTHALLMGWSPDGKWIVHMGVNGHIDGFYEIDQIWVVSADGQIVEPLYIPSEYVFEERITGWISNQTFLSEGWGFEAPLAFVLEVDIEEKSNQRVFELPSMGVAYNPDSEVILANVSGFLGPGPEIEHGLYLKYLTGKEPELIFSGDFHWLQYHSELGLFSAVDSMGDLLLLDSKGSIELKLTGSERINPSPDGSFLFASSMDKSLIMGSNGHILKDIFGGGSVAWSPDSDVLFRIDSDGLFVYRAEEEWRQFNLNIEFDVYSWLRVLE